MDVIVTKHAWQQYCSRVESITYEDLTDLLTEQLSHPERRKRDFIKLDGVWWIMIEPFTFVTCYGRSDLDLPKAIGWAVRHNDRIVLDDA